MLDARDANKPLTVYSKQGAELRTLQPGDMQEVHHCCVTADHFGYLSVDPTILLPAEVDTPPWCINLYELDHFLEGLTLRGWGAERLRDYITDRIRLFGKVQTSDELEIAGVFLTRGSLNNLLRAPGDRVFLMPELAKVFNDIYLYRIGSLKKIDFNSYPEPVHQDMRAMVERAIREIDAA